MNNPVIIHEEGNKRFGIEGAERIEYPEVKCVMYIHNELQIILVWEGSRKKPVKYARYSDAKYFQESVEMEKRMVERRIQEIKDFEEKCKAKCIDILENCDVGDVLYSSWGFEQTNIDFYQVVAKKGKKFSFRRLKSICDYNAHTMQGQKVPDVDNFWSDEIIEKSLSKYGNFKLSSYQSLSPLEYELEDGKKVYKSQYYSCYA